MADIKPIEIRLNEAIAKSLKDAKNLLKMVLEDNYDLSNGREIDPELRDKIEDFLNI